MSHYICSQSLENTTERAVELCLSKIFLSKDMKTSWQGMLHALNLASQRMKEYHDANVRHMMQGSLRCLEQVEPFHSNLYNNNCHVHSKTVRVTK